MEHDQSQIFNERLSQWVANQGFWFQVRYSMSGAGMRGRAMFHLLRMGFRLLIFLLLLTAATWVYLVKRTESARFNEALKGNLQSALSASELEIRGFQQLQGQLEIPRLAAQGGTGTFFDAMELRNIRCKMGLLDGLVGTWRPGTIAIARVEMDLRAGTDDAESAAKLSQAVFRKPENVEVNTLDIADATLRWGYSERTQGAIESSELKVQRIESGWRLSFSGGTFEQNWLRKMQIVSMVVLCDKGGLVFEKAELKDGSGTVDFSGLRLRGGERPEVDGIAKIRNLDLETILPPALRSFVEGTISGDFKVFGSTNNSDGIGFEGQVVLDGEDVISLRDRVHLLKALSVVDYSRNYHRVDFRDGAFQMRTHRGGLQLTEVSLKAEDLLTLDGAVNVRLPTQQEIEAALAREGAGMEASPLFVTEQEAEEARKLPTVESQFTLKRAAQEARRIREGTQSMDSLSLFDRLGLSIEMRRLQNQASERMSRMLRYEGAFRITIPGDAFERAPRLQQLYPMDQTNGRVAMRVPIDGYLYELSLMQAEDIYQQGQR
jgi:hypothetical protein